MFIIKKGTTIVMTLSFVQFSCALLSEKKVEIV
jgi:hypothetical protein